MDTKHLINVQVTAVAARAASPPAGAVWGRSGGARSAGPWPEPHLPGVSSAAPRASHAGVPASAPASPRAPAEVSTQHVKSPVPPRTLRSHQLSFPTAWTGTARSTAASRRSHRPPWTTRAARTAAPRAPRTWRSSFACACACSASSRRPSGTMWEPWSSWCRWVRRGDAGARRGAGGIVCAGTGTGPSISGTWIRAWMRVRGSVGPRRESLMPGDARRCQGLGELLVWKVSWNEWRLLFRESRQPLPLLNLLYRRPGLLGCSVLPPLPPTRLLFLPWRFCVRTLTCWLKSVC